VAISAVALAQEATAQPKTADAPASTSTASEGIDDPGLCVDQEIANRLAVKRKRRQNVDRLFIKQARHEISAFGGYYASDLYSATWVVGGAYTYHMTDDVGVEFTGAYTRSNADIIRTLEDDRGVTIDDTADDVIMAEALLIWSPVYGKLRLGGSIVRFDMHLDAGVGVVDADTSRGISAVGGVGFKLLFPEAFAVRIDIRDHVYRQELLDQGFIVNDVSATLGLSVFLPFGN